MALLRWDEEEEKKEEDGFAQPNRIAAVNSVQSSWQPTQETTNPDGTTTQPQETQDYLMSEEKAQADEQLRQKKAAEAARRAEMARQAAIARQNDAINRENAQIEAEANAQAQADAKAQSAAKYQGGKKKNEGGFTGFLKDVGAGIQQGLSGLADVAIQGGAVIGSIGKNDQELMRHMEQSQKVRNWLYSFKDINNENLKGTSGADSAASRVSSGQGSLEDWAKVGGTGLQAGIDATMFMNPARLAAAGLKPVTTQSVSLLARTAKSPAVRFAMRDAAFFGSLQGTATFQTAYAESGGDLEAATEAALKDMAIGGVLQGSLDLAGTGVNKVANRTVNSLRRPGEVVPAGSPIDELELTPIRDEPTSTPNEITDGNVSFEKPTTDAPVADGVVTPATPNTPQYTPVADNLTPVVDEPTMPEPPTEWADEFNGQTPPDWNEVTAREVAAVREQPVEAPAVADGTAQPPVSPVENMPTIKTEQVRALQEARAGKTQADEAVINQELQQVQNETPSVYRSEDPERYGIGQAELGNGLYTGSKETAGRRKDGTISKEGLYEYKVNPEAKVLDASSDEFRSLDSKASTHPSLKEEGISETEWRNRKTQLLGQYVREAGYDGVKRGDNQFVGMSERALTPVTEGAPTYRGEPDAPTMRDDTLADARGVKESEIAENIHIKELDNSLETIRQRRQQMIADGRSENYHGVKQLDKAADAIIREQESIAKELRTGDDVMRDDWGNDVPEWERQRNRALAMTERVGNSLEAGIRVKAGRRVIGTSFAKGYKQNAEALKNAAPNKSYEINPKTGKPEEHPSSEILAAFSRSMGEDLPPIILGNTPKPGAGRRLDTNTAGANATYSPSFSRLDYKEKRSVYHETVHHIDHFINDYQGDNPKMRELQQLRKEITPEEVRKYAKVDSSADNVYEYVAHAMDLLLDGRLKKGEVGQGVLTYIKAFFTEVKDALSSAHVYGRKGIETVRYIKELDKAIHEIDTRKMLPQEPLTPTTKAPSTSNLPPKMQPAAPKPTVAPIKPPVKPPVKPVASPVKPPTKPSVEKPVETPEPPVKPVKKGENYLQRTIAGDASSKDVRSRLQQVSESKGADMKIDEILDNIAKLKPSIREKIEKNYAIVEAAEKRINQIQNTFRKDAGKENGGTMSLDRARELARERNKLVQTMQIAEKNLNSSIRRIESRQSKKARLLNAGANLTSYSQGNMLASLPVQEKNLVGDIIASVVTTIQHPIKMALNIPEARLASEFRRVGREVAQVTPQTLSEVPKYLIRSALSPVYAINNSMANVRGGLYRNEFARAELVKAGIKKPTAEQIKIQAVRAGNAREILVNLNKGVGSAMSDPYKAAKAADEYFKVLEKSTSHKELAEFAQNTRESTEILQGMMSAGKGNDGKVTAMSLLVNNIYPFINPAVNSFKNAVYMLDPSKASQVNQVRKIIQSPTRQNIARLTKMGGTAAALTAVVALLEDETIAYNDGDSDVSRPRGWSVKTGDNTYMPARAFGVFEPFLVGTGVIYEVMNGRVKTPGDALKMAASSLPYLSSHEFYMQSLTEMGEGNPWGYGTQSQAVARTKNLVPFVNNGVERWSDRNAGKSTDARSAYASKKNAEGETVPDFMPWLGNSIKAGFGDTEGLKKSYTPAGQVRTADNQGAFVNKTINDKNTQTFNDAIKRLVSFGRDNELGKDAKEMFNTYPTDKNNNFKSVQDAITFLGVEEGAKIDKASLLENNPELADLAAQIRDGFYGTTGDDLLMLNGQELKSDASVPNKSGTKNSKLPVNMQSIKNAIAATDLPKEQTDRMYEISQANQALYEQRKAKVITYEQEQAAKAINEQEYVNILSGSANYKKMNDLMGKLDEEGFFKQGGIGSTKSGQTYLWNSLNALLGAKGATPAANYPEAAKSGWGNGGGGGGRGKGFNATLKDGASASAGIKWTPVGKREMAMVKSGKYTPVEIRVKLNNAIKKNKTQNYSDRSF